MTLQSICVYCGSSAGALALYSQGAQALAKELVERQIELVYGGGNVGLMGIMADEVLRLGGTVTGVIPQALLEQEIGHPGLTRLHIVNDMHERKALMAELSEGFIAMPGGIGTLEELFEALTWSQIGFHDKPVGLLNVNGFYDGLISFMRHLVQEKFLKPNQAGLLMHEADAATLLARFQAFQPDPSSKILNRRTAQSLLP